MIMAGQQLEARFSNSVNFKVNFENNLFSFTSFPPTENKLERKLEIEIKLSIEHSITKIW